MLKRMKFLAPCLIMSVLLYGCGSEEVMEGHWISGDGKYSVSFDGDSTVVVDGKYIGEYEIYSEGKMAINVDTDTFDEVLDITMSAEFVLDDDILTINDLESGQSYVYYRQEKANLYINDDYAQKSVTYSGLREFIDYDSLGCFDDDGNLVKDFEWETDELDKTIKEMRKNAEKIFNEEVLPLYEQRNPDGKYHIFSDCLLGVNGAMMNEIELRCEGAGTLSIVDRFVIEPKDGLIYIQDLVEGTYEMWDGTVIDGKSLFD